MSENERHVRTSELVERIHYFLDEDMCVSKYARRMQFGIGVATVHSIFHEYLNMHKICAKSVVKVLSDEQKERRISYSKERINLSVFNSLVTCVELLIHCYDPET